jgi:CxxC motif-containing protein (DUF1111 family)
MAKLCLMPGRSLVSIAAVMLGATALLGLAVAQEAPSFQQPNQNVAQNAVTANTQGARRGGGGGSRAVDPGVRGGAPGVGGPLPGLGPNELAFFTAAQTNFQEVETFASGLGPRMNLNQCSGCHIQPAVGGSSPAVNPQVAFQQLLGPPNTLPSFITASGPIREARFIKNPDGTPDGGVHDLFVVTPTVGAPAACQLQQPNFTQAVAQNNVIFRIPTPLFGAGLVENHNDRQLQMSFNANAGLKAQLGISGHFNTSANDGTITKFGWKAQNKSLLIFAGEAYNVEMGVTNDNFPDERETNPNCAVNPTPESTTNLTTGNTTVAQEVTNFNQDIVNFAAFMRLSAPPTPASSGTTPTAQSTPGLTVQSTAVASVLPLAAGSQAGSSPSTTTSASASTTRGQQVFTNIGCQGCHVVSQTTGNSAFTGQSNVTFQPFSDFAVHSMGVQLADGISQGNANGNQFRTAPLWGIGQRIFFLHDGRTNNLVTAIEQHASSGSEANQVIENFNMLSTNDQQALVNFLRSL